jgi:GNAT superfamily N-acetyltransferase
MDGIAAIEQITRNCYGSFARIRGAEVIDDGSVFGVMSHVGIPFFSGIATTNISEDDVAAVIDRFRAKRCAFRWWVTPSTRPAGLAERLQAHGMRHAYDAPGMAADLTTLDLDVPLPANVTIRRLRGPDEMTDWIDVVATTYATPPNEAVIWRDAFEQCGFGDDAAWAHFVANLGGEAVATTSIMVERGLAGVYMVATLPQARGRGIGAAVTRAAMRFARDRGATEAALQSSEIGYGVYRGLGFVEYCNLRLYDWRPEY